MPGPKSSKKRVRNVGSSDSESAVIMNSDGDSDAITASIPMHQKEEKRTRKKRDRPPHNGGVCRPSSR